MPVCFQLFRKDGSSREPLVLQDVDEEICKHFEVPCDPVKWVCGWFDSIGFRLACGKSFAQIREEFGRYVEEEKAEGNEDHVRLYVDLGNIAEFMEGQYSTSSFYSPYKD